jgi:hypothetical protein
MKFVAITAAALILIVAGVWYFSQYGTNRDDTSWSAVKEYYNKALASNSPSLIAEASYRVIVRVEDDYYALHGTYSDEATLGRLLSQTGLSAPDSISIIYDYKPGIPDTGEDAKVGFTVTACWSGINPASVNTDGSCRPRIHRAPKTSK